MDFLEKFPHRILIGDGDITTTLRHSHLPAHLGFPNLSITHPDAVLHAHSTAINAGALLIKSNSRDANALSLKNFGIERRVSEINWMAAQLAQNAARQAGVEMVGSVGPLPISTEEALRLANARTEAGTGTQLDELNAQTALTIARSTQIEALHALSVARARLERAMGLILNTDGK